MIQQSDKVFKQNFTKASSYQVQCEYPDVKNAKGLRVNCNRIFLTDYVGISWNWSGGINIPHTADIKGTLNVLFITGTGVSSSMPFFIWVWGIVADIKG
jgi:hypothetical protein